MPEYDWMHSVYGTKGEDMIEDMPPPKGKPMRISAFVDSALAVCRVSGRSSTGFLILVNQTLVDWYTKLQKPVQTATYGSEFVAARTCTDAIVDIQYTLCSMGVAVEDQAWMLGDNQSVITSSTIPWSLLGKRHNALSYHRVRSAIAHKLLKFCYVPSAENVGDVLTKFLGYKKYWPLILPLLFWGGETAVKPSASASAQGEC